MITRDAKLVTHWVSDRSGAVVLHPHPGIGWLVDGKLTAGLYFDDYSGSNVWVHAACDGCFPLPFSMAVSKLIFDDMRCARCTLSIRDNNVPCLRLARAMGAIHECTIRKGHSGGDVLLYALWRNTGIHRRLSGRKTHHEQEQYSVANRQ